MGACRESGGLWENMHQLEGCHRKLPVSVVCWGIGWGSCPWYMLARLGPPKGPGGTVAPRGCTERP